jgi:hypothetical protein
MASTPGLTWTGTRYIVRSNDATNANLLAIAGDGTRGIETPLVARSMGNPYGPQMLAWTGSELYAAYSVNGIGQITRFDGALTPLGAPFTHASTSPDFDTSLLWDRDHLLVAWVVSQQEYMRELAPDGTPRTLEIPVSGHGQIQLAGDNIAFFGNTGFNPVFLTLVARDGTTIGSRQVSTAAAGVNISALDFAARGAVLATMWLENSTARSLHYQLFELSGEPITGDTIVPLLTANTYLGGDIRASSNGFMIMAVEAAVNFNIMTMEIGPDGSVLRSPGSLSARSSASMAGPMLAVADHRQVVAMAQAAGLQLAVSCQ